MPHCIEVVAHRGASGHEREHTYEAYDLALEMGSDALEVDVRATRDGTLVVLHDRTLARTTGDPRDISEVALGELPDGHRPLSLEEVLDRYADGTRWLVELKQPTPATAEAIVTAIERRGIEQLTTIQSFDHAALQRLQRLSPVIDVAPLFCETSPPAAILAAMPQLSRYAAGVGVPQSASTPAVIRAAHSRGLRLRAYTVNDVAEMSRLARLGADGLITDFPDRARAVSTAPPLAAAA